MFGIIGYMISLGLFSLPVASFVWFIISLVRFISNKTKNNKSVFVQLIVSGILSFLIFVGAVCVIGFLVYTFLTTPMTGM